MSSKFLACFFSAALLALPYLFPPFFPLSWVAFVPLLWAVQHVTIRQGLLFGWLTGIIAHLVGFYWLNYTIKVFGGYSYELSAVIFLLFGAYSGLPFALFTLLVRRCGFGPLSLFPALFWVAIEFWFPSLFPWHLAGSQSEFLVLIQSADLVGPFGTSFLLMWVNTTLYAGIFSRRGKLWLRETAVFGAVLLFSPLYGLVVAQSVGGGQQVGPGLGVCSGVGGDGIPV